MSNWSRMVYALCSQWFQSTEKYCCYVELIGGNNVSKLITIQGYTLRQCTSCLKIACRNVGVRVMRACAPLSRPYRNNR